MILPLLLVAGCGKKEQQLKGDTVQPKPTGMVIKNEKKQRSNIVNNMIVGKSKISFNNESYNLMSDGNFTQDKLWGTFQQKKNRQTSIQINAANSEQDIYGDLDGYELEGIKWDEDEYVQYLGVMEEAIQYSQDKKVVMYKARTGDVIFSVAMFGQKELTEKEILSLKKLAKGITIEYVEGQLTTSGI